MSCPKPCSPCQKDDDDERTHAAGIGGGWRHDVRSIIASREVEECELEESHFSKEKKGNVTTRKSVRGEEEEARLFNAKLEGTMRADRGKI